MSLNQSSSNLSSTDAVEKQKNPDSYQGEQQNYHLQNNEDPSIGIRTVLPTYPKRWYKMKHIQRLMWVIFIISLTSCNTGYDGSLLNSLYTEKDFNNAIGNVSGSILGALTNGYVFGCLISFLFSARMNDMLGRKKCLIYCNIIMIIGVLLQSVAGAWKHDGYPEHYTKRDVLGMMIAVAYPDPTARSIQINYYNSNWYLGAIVAAWVAFGVKKVKHHWSWRIPTILQCLFAICQLILVPYFVPESPRWYVSQGRYEEAREVLNDLHAGHLEVAQELVEYEMTEIQLAIEQEKAAAQTNYKDLFKTKANLKRMWIICWVAIFMQLSGNGLVSYYLGKVLSSIGYTSTSEQLIINAGLMIYNLGVCVIQSFWIVPLVKKRVILMKASVGGMLVSYIIWTILSAKAQQDDFRNKAMGKSVLAFIFIYYFFYNLGLNGLPFTYCTEILPYTIRAKGLSVFTAVQFVVQIYNGFVNPIAMDAIHWKTLEEVADVFGDGITDLGAVSGIAALTDGKGKNNAEDTEFIE
ncbi:unnamed protein product [Hanseniaspora opuntiae]